MQKWRSENNLTLCKHKINTLIRKLGIAMSSSIIKPMLLQETFWLYSTKSLHTVTFNENGLKIQCISTGEITHIDVDDIVGCLCGESSFETFRQSSAASFTVAAYPLETRCRRAKRRRRLFVFRVDKFACYEDNSALARRWEQTVSASLTENGTFPRALVIVNPYGGTGKADTLFSEMAAPILNDAGIKYAVVRTERRLHAKEMAAKLNLKDVDAIVVCSGDGVLHEVLNGLGSRHDAEVALKTPIGVLPGGTSNALASCLLDRDQHSASYVNSRSSSTSVDSSHDPSPFMTRCSLLAARWRPSPLDLMRVETDDGEVRYSFLSLTYGLVADVDIESERFRRCGLFRNTLGAITRILGLRTYRCRISFSPTTDMSESTTLVSSFTNDAGTLDTTSSLVPNTSSTLPPLSEMPPAEWKVLELEIVAFCAVNISHLASDAVICAPASPNDGIIHLVVIRKGISKMDLIEVLGAIETAEGYHRLLLNPFIDFYCCSAVRLETLTPGIVVIDGEKLEGCTAIQAEIKPGAARVMSSAKI